MEDEMNLEGKWYTPLVQEWLIQYPEPHQARAERYLVAEFEVLDAFSDGNVAGCPAISPEEWQEWLQAESDYVGLGYQAFSAGEVANAVRTKGVPSSLAMTLPDRTGSERPISHLYQVLCELAKEWAGK